MSPPLPPEVARAILDQMVNLGLQSVLCASRVSQSWRLAAHSHPVFSRDICIVSDHRGPSNGAVHLFLDRLAARPGCNLCVDIRIGSYWSRLERAGADRVRKAVLPALRQSLARLVQLTIECDRSLVPDFAAALCSGPAPRLRDFKFLTPLTSDLDSDDSDAADSDSDERPTLPLDVFAGHAPQLRTLQIDAFQFPERAVPAFSRVCAITWIFLSEIRFDMHPGRFFVSCPALHELSIYRGALHGEDWTLCPPPSVSLLRRLTVLEVDWPEDTGPAVRSLSYAQTEVVEVQLGLVEADTADFLLGHLDDSAALEIEISHACKMSSWDPHVPTVCCTVTDAAHARRRSFTHFIDESMRELEDSLQPGIEGSFGRIAPRVTGISAYNTAIAWECLALLFLDAGLSGVQTVTVRVGEKLGFFGELEGDPDAAVALPSLTRIRLVAEDEGMVDVRAQALSYVVDTLWRVPDGRTLEIELVNVSLIDNQNMLSNRFKIVGTSS